MDRKKEKFDDFLDDNHHGTLFDTLDTLRLIYFTLQLCILIKIFFSLVSILEIKFKKRLPGARWQVGVLSVLLWLGNVSFN